MGGNTLSCVFISYRRDDSADSTGRIYDRLSAHFGEAAIFKDVDDIPLGTDFKDYIGGVLSKCNVELVIIGPDWVTITDNAGNPRLDDPNDFVRIEVETGLARGIPVIPVLVGGAFMPSLDELPKSLAKLASRNGIQVRRDPDFHRDVNRLIGKLERYVKPESIFGPLARVYKLLDGVEGWTTFEKIEGTHYKYHQLYPEFRVSDRVHDEGRQFQEEWSQRLPDPNLRRYVVELYYQGTLLKEMVLVSCDGDRYMLPLPRRREDGSWEVNLSSFEYKVARLYPQYPAIPLDEVLTLCGVQLVDHKLDDLG